MNKLSAGDRAPSFSLTDLHGNRVSLEDFRGRKLLLSFYRYASCPFCNLQVHALSKRAPDWQARGLDLVAVFQSPRESILEHAGKEPKPFAILPDPARALYRAYGVEGSWAGFAKAGLQFGKLAAALKEGFLPGRMEGDINMVPADFLIDEEGRVALAYYGRDISDHLDLDQVERFLEGSLAAGAPAAAG